MVSLSDVSIETRQNIEGEQLYINAFRLLMCRSELLF